ncbi:multicopper oxidase family protein [Blastococcus sp. SYSU D01050]
MDDPTLSRRDALKVGALGAAALALPLAVSADAKRASELSENRLPRPFARQTRLVRPPVLGRTGVDPAPTAAEERDVYDVTMRQFGAQLVPGFTTTMWGYQGMFPGPTIRVQRRRRARVRFTNDLPVRHPVFRYEPTTSVHLHGAPSLPQYDGYANDTSRPGQYKDYLYDNQQEARTLWYHDHAVHHTAENVAMGLAGQYHVVDPLEDALGLPQGDYDVPLIVTDVAFTSRGQLLYDDRSDSGPMGDVLLVNGVPFPAFPVEPRRYRFRLLNASIARGYRFRLSPSAPLTVIGTDGGLVHDPVDAAEIRMGMGERYDVVVDFTPFRGRRVELRNLGVENSVDYDFTDRVAAFDVLPTATDLRNNGPVPDTLDIPEHALMGLRPEQAVRTRRLAFERGGSEWTINDLTWADVEQSQFRRVIADPALGDVELWEFENGSGGWFHPVHLHLVDFRVLSRNGRPPAAHESAGPKDVVYLGENETIRVLTQFGAPPAPPPAPDEPVPLPPRIGRYMLHCHNNTHEDHDMMTQFEVGTGGPSPFDAPPQGVPKLLRPG